VSSDFCCHRSAASSLDVDPDLALSRDRHGLGKPRSVGVSSSVRLRAPLDGSEVTTSGSYRLLSAWSIAAVQATCDADLNRAVEKTRMAWLPQAAHGTDGGAVPSGRMTSNEPSCSHRYS
jgi:hypothetical protein